MISESSIRSKQIYSTRLYGTGTVDARITLDVVLQLFATIQ